MNLDLIQKLAKLANNNPNENEANAAARKVCRLLAEGNFKFSNDPVITRTKEPDFKSTRTTNYRPSDEHLKDIFEWFNKQYKEPPRQAPPKYKPYNPFEDWDQPKRPERKTKCVRCGLDVWSFNLTDPFICTICKEKERKAKTEGAFSDRVCFKCYSTVWKKDIIRSGYVCQGCNRFISEVEWSL